MRLREVPAPVDPLVKQGGQRPWRRRVRRFVRQRPSMLLACSCLPWSSLAAKRAAVTAPPGDKRRPHPRRGGLRRTVRRPTAVRQRPHRRASPAQPPGRPSQQRRLQRHPRPDAPADPPTFKAHRRRQNRLQILGELLRPVAFSSMVGVSAGSPVRGISRRGAPRPRRPCPLCRASADAVGLTVADVVTLGQRRCQRKCPAASLGRTRSVTPSQEE
jgi:hypothetical protein